MGQQQQSASFASQTDGDRRYHWIEPEAEKLISRAYARHQSLVERDLTLPNGWKSFPPSISLQDLEAEGIATDFHYEPKTFGDKVALKLVKGGEWLMHLSFEKSTTTMLSRLRLLLLSQASLVRPTGLLATWRSAHIGHIPSTSRRWITEISRISRQEQLPSSTTTCQTMLPLGMSFST